MKYVEYVEVSKEERDRINRLLEIPSLEEMTDEELVRAGANTDQYECLFLVQFKDGSFLTWDLCSGQHNYYDNVVWTGVNGEEIVFDCSYVFDDIEFDVINDRYEVHFVDEQEE